MVFLWTLMADKALWKKSFLFVLSSIAGAAIAFGIITFFGTGIVIQVMKSPSGANALAQACDGKIATSRGLK